MTVLATPRLILRRFELADTEALTRAVCNPETTRFLPHFAEPGAAETWIQKNLRRYEYDGIGKWALVLKSTGELVGYTGLVKVPVDEVVETEVGYALSPWHRGQGLATEAARACMAYALGPLGVRRIISLILEQNLASRRVAERNGMTLWKEAPHAGLTHLVYVASKNPP